MFSHEHISFVQSLHFHQFSSLIIMLTNTLIRRTNERGLGTCKKKMALRMRDFRLPPKPTCSDVWDVNAAFIGS